MPDGCHRFDRFEHQVDAGSHLVLLQAFARVITGEGIGCTGAFVDASGTIDVVVESPGVYTVRTESDPYPEYAAAPATVSVEAAQVASGSSSDR